MQVSHKATGVLLKSSHHLNAQQIGMSDQQPCENGNPNCDFDDKHELSLVGEVLRTIERYSKRKKISPCPSCLRDSMLSVAAILHLEATKIETAKTRKPHSGKRLGDTFAKSARSRLESVRQANISKTAPGKH
jgi:hypothetical protein